MAIPSLLLRQLYTFGSLQNTDQGVQFSIKNRLSDARLTGITRVTIDGESIPLEYIQLYMPSGHALHPAEITSQTPVDFPLRQIMDVHTVSEALDQGKHIIEIWFESQPFGKLKLKVEDSISESDEHLVRIPRSNLDNY
ncbi:MAG: hydroxymethylglutaryl-CoA reductase, partial [Anaerolineales bacterium]